MQQVITSANIVVVPCKRTQHVQGFQNKPAAGGVPPVTLSFPAERNFKTNSVFREKFSKNSLFTLEFEALNMIYNRKQKVVL